MQKLFIVIGILFTVVALMKWVCLLNNCVEDISIESFRGDSRYTKHHSYAKQQAAAKQLDYAKHQSHGNKSHYSSTRQLSDSKSSYYEQPWIGSYGYRDPYIYPWYHPYSWFAIPIYNYDTCRDYADSKCHDAIFPERCYANYYERCRYGL